MISFNTLVLVNGDPEEFFGCRKGGGDHFFQLHIGFDFSFVEIKPRRADFLGVEPPVPWCNSMIVPFSGNQFRKVHGFFCGTVAGLFPHGLQKRAHILRGFGHRVVELEMGKAGIAKQCRLLGAQLHHFSDKRPVVPFTRSLTTCSPRLECFLPQISTLGKCQERFDDRT